MIELVRSVIEDARHAARQLSRRPIATACIVMMLGLGIGISCALFAFVHAVETSPPPGIPHDESLVRIRGIAYDAGNAIRSGRALSTLEVEAFTDSPHLFAGVAAWTRSTAELSTPALRTPLSVPAILATHDYFDLLDVQLALGRFSAETSAVVVSYGLWQTLYGGVHDVIGSDILINGRPLTITGVAPQGFRGATIDGDDRMVWLPQSAGSSIAIEPIAVPADPQWYAVARLRPGLRPADVRREAERLSERALASAPAAAADSRRAVDIVPLRATNDQPSAPGARSVYLTLGMLALLILAIVAATAGSLLVGLAIQRRLDTAVRLSLGASRLRLARQFFTEGVLLALAGAALGLMLLAALLRLLRHRIPFDVTVQWHTLAFAAAVAVIVGLLASLAPVFHATRLSLAGVMKQSHDGPAPVRLGAQRRLVILQIALSQPLLIALVTMMGLTRTPEPVPSTDERARRTMVLGYENAAGAAGDVLRDIVTRLEATPGVAGAVPHDGSHLRSSLAADTRAGDASSAAAFHGYGHFAAPGYFALMDIPVVRGRAFEPADGDDVVIVGSDLARTLWGDADPLGRTLLRWRNRDTVALTVVGVVDAGRAGTSAQAGGRRVYLPLGAEGRGGIRMVPPGRSMHEVLALRQTATPAVTARLREAARPATGPLRLAGVASLADIDAGARAARTRVFAVAAIASLVTVLIACIGLFAIVQLTVAERIREIGIRIALGGRARHVVGRFTLIGLKLALTGLLLGLPLGLFGLRMIAPVVDAPSAVIAAATTVLVLALTAFASWLPAMRASSVDPNRVLRTG